MSPLPNVSIRSRFQSAACSRAIAAARIKPMSSDLAGVCARWTNGRKGGNLLRSVQGRIADGIRCTLTGFNTNVARTAPEYSAIMLRPFHVVPALCLALLLGSAPASAQNEQADKAKQQAAEQAKKDTQRPNDLAEVSKQMTGPAGNPECVWLGRRVVHRLFGRTISIPPSATWTSTTGSAVPADISRRRSDAWSCRGRSSMRRRRKTS